MRCRILLFWLLSLLMAAPSGAAIVSIEDAVPVPVASPLVLAPRLANVQAHPTVLVDAALFNIVSYEVQVERASRNVVVVPKRPRQRAPSLLQLGSAALSQGAVYTHSMVGLFELLGSDAWRDASPPLTEGHADGHREDGDAESALAGPSSDLAVSLYTVLGATAFAASPLYLALGSMAAESLLAAPVAPMPPFALFIAAGIVGVVLVGKKRRR